MFIYAWLIFHCHFDSKFCGQEYASYLNREKFSSFKWKNNHVQFKIKHQIKENKIFVMYQVKELKYVYFILMIEIYLYIRDWYFIVTSAESWVDKNMLVIQKEKMLNSYIIEITVPFKSFSNMITGCEFFKEIVSTSRMFTLVLKDVPNDYVRTITFFH